MNKKVLIVDTDPGVRQILKRFLTAQDYEVITSSNGTKALTDYKETPTDMVICDLRLGDMDGLEMMEKIKEMNPVVPFMVMSDNTDVRIAVTTMKSGAADFFPKPLVLDEMLESMKRAWMENETTTTTTTTTSSPKTKRTDKTEYTFSSSEHSKELLKQIELVSQTNYSVIIYGESGAGKEAIAQTIHKKSNRADGPFVTMDCGAISKELAGSELFGHEKGSFTGAHSTKIGQFELANGGTLFLDEIANLPYDVQSSLLRVIQERKVRRIGGNKEISFDVRIIIASNENLEDSYKKGKFREDLFHRFNEFQITILPLRDRKEDIMYYANYFLKESNEELNKNITGFDEEVITLFMNNKWDGNLRELKNIIRRAVLLTDGDTILTNALPYNFAETRTIFGTELNFSPNGEYEHANTIPVDNNGLLVDKEGQQVRNLKKVALQAECELIQQVLKQTNYNKSKAAKVLKVNRKTLYNKIRSYNLEKTSSQ